MAAVSDFNILEPRDTGKILVSFSIDFLSFFVKPPSGPIIIPHLENLFLIILSCFTRLIPFKFCSSQNKIQRSLGQLLK